MPSAAKSFPVERTVEWAFARLFARRRLQPLSRAGTVWRHTFASIFAEQPWQCARPKTCFWPLVVGDESGVPTLTPSALAADVEKMKLQRTGFQLHH